jgi:hypothetical protein
MSLILLPSRVYLNHVLTMNSYDSFKIFMGLPTTGGPAKQLRKPKRVPTVLGFAYRASLVVEPRARAEGNTEQRYA